MNDYFRVLRSAKCPRRFLLKAALLTIAASVLAVLQPWPLALLVNHVLGHDPAPRLLQSALRNPATAVPLLALAGFLLYVLGSFVDAILAWSWTATGRGMVYRLARELFARLQRRSLLFHKRSTVADLMGRVSVDSWSAYQVMDSLVFGPAHALLTSALMIFLMARLDPTLTVLAVALGPVMILASLFLGKPLRTAALMRRQTEVDLQSHIQQTLTGIPVVQAFGQEDRENRRFRLFAESAIRSQQRSAMLASLNGLSSGLVTVLGSGVILWTGAQHVRNGMLSVGAILIFLNYLASLQGQVKVFAGLYAALQNLHPAVTRTLNVLETEPEIKDLPGSRPVRESRGEIEFDRVTAGYTAGEPVLKEISLSAPAGKSIAIVGASGAGKTTLISLIPRFLEPWEGRIRLDGQDIRELQLRDLRDQIALVLQEPHLFPVSIEENISYGRPSATREEIEAAARSARAHEFISRLPQGYQTIIGERGATLSGGERQRLSIARAFLKNAPILILDEPTSALDLQTENLLLEALRRLMQNRTTFVIAHRLSTVRHSDQLIVLREGRIVELGTHNELLALSGHYFHLHQIQNTAASATPTLTAPRS